MLAVNGHKAVLIPGLLESWARGGTAAAAELLRLSDCHRAPESKKPAQWRACEMVELPVRNGRLKWRVGLSLREPKSASVHGARKPSILSFRGPLEYQGEIKHLSSPIPWHLIAAGIHALRVCVVVLVLDSTL